MDQFSVFYSEKESLINKLKKLQNILMHLSQIDVDVRNDLNKIQRSIENITNDMLSIALVGAFSDGKTSVVAGWLGRVFDDMKINTDESSDALTVYQPVDFSYKSQIIDTPGLFGDKEKIDAVGNIENYADITKKYISEANLIFYVVDATNPLKDSHKQTVRWLLQDLNKLSSTIFIINKMDEVSDLRDQEDFDNQSKIKKDNLIQKLDKFVDISKADKECLNIVCISSNPNGRGLDFWLNDKPNEYIDRSRINFLKSITHNILDKNSRNDLIKKASLDVINDIVAQKIKYAEEQFAQYDLLEERLSTHIQRLEQDIKDGMSSVIQSKEELFYDLTEYEKRLLSDISVLSSPKDFKDFIDTEIGSYESDFGYKLISGITHKCDSSSSQISKIMEGITVKIDNEIKQSESLVDTLSSISLNGTSKALQGVSNIPVTTIKSSIFFARDVLASLTGVVIKFKPWEVANLAAGISKWAGPAGSAFQFISVCCDEYQQQQRENEIKEWQSNLSEVVKEQFKHVYDILNNEEVLYGNFAPQISSFKKILNKQKEELGHLQKKRQILISIKNDFHANFAV